MNHQPKVKASHGGEERDVDILGDMPANHSGESVCEKDLMKAMRGLLKDAQKLGVPYAVWPAQLLSRFRFESRAQRQGKQDNEAGGRNLPAEGSASTGCRQVRTY